MGVHASSVISTQLLNYHSNFYYTLCDKEEYCYTQSQQTDGTIENYTPFFQDLSDALVATFTGSYAVSNFQDMTQAAYSARIMDIQFNIFTDLDALLDAYNVFDMGGVLSEVLNNAIDYYDDLVMVTDPETMIETAEAPNLEAATATVSTNAVSDANSEAQSIANTISNEVRSMVNKLMYNLVYSQEEVNDPDFVDPGSPYLVRSSGPPAKTEMYNLVFTQPGYEALLPVFNITGVDPING